MVTLIQHSSGTCAISIKQAQKGFTLPSLQVLRDLESIAAGAFEGRGSLERGLRNGF